MNLVISTKFRYIYLTFQTHLTIAFELFTLVDTFSFQC